MPITKKHKSILFSGIALMAGATLLTGCASDPLPVSKSEQYTRDFIKTFGVFDQSHDWNHATQSTVTVTTPAPTEVKIMADFEGKRYIFASYTNVEGTKTLNVDIPKGVSDLIVVANGKNYSVKAGGEIRIAGNRSRIVSDPASEGASGVTATICEEENWMVVPMLNATIFRRRMPENCYNANRDNVSVDFTFKFKENDIIVRPIYWQTRHTHEFGFFYLDEDNKPVHLPVYQMEKGSKGTSMDDKVLCWAPTKVRTYKVTDFVHDPEFVECMKNQGLEVVTRHKIVTDFGSPWEFNYDYPDITSLDNFHTKTSATDDKKMTFACREYLNRKGIINDPTADEEHRFNYVYRWRITGERTISNDTNEQVYDPDFVGTDQNPKQDLEIVYTYYNYDYAKADGWGTDVDMQNGINMEIDSENYVAFISKGIKVHFDDISKTYGGYVKRDDGRYLYSMSSLNEKNRWIPKPGAERVWTDEFGGQMVYNQEDFIVEEGKKAFRAATWVGTKYNWRYMSFEDGIIGDTYSRNSCDFDMQDFVFIIDNADPEYDDPIEEIVTPDDPKTEEWEWIIACEDLGTNDFDFNDVVFSVSYPKTEITEGQEKKTVTVKALAAGGTLPVYLSYGNADNYLKPEGASSAEFHSWFGGYSSNHVINAAGTKATGMSVTIEVPADFTMSCTDRVANGNMGGFIVTVKHSDKNIQIEATNPKFDQSKNPELIGTAPQMICVPANWCWPTENTFILDVYEHFSKWCENPDQNEHWHSEANRAPSGYWKR